MATMQAIDLIKDIRQANGDEDENVWKDERYIRAINAAERVILRDHQESRLDSAGDLLTYTAIPEGNPAVDCNLDDHYRDAVIAHVLKDYFGADSGDSRDEARAAKAEADYKAFFTPGA